VELAGIVHGKLVGVFERKRLRLGGSEKKRREVVEKREEKRPRTLRLGGEKERGKKRPFNCCYGEVVKGLKKRVCTKRKRGVKEKAEKNFEGKGHTNLVRTRGRERKESAEQGGGEFFPGSRRTHKTKV